MRQLWIVGANFNRLLTRWRARVAPGLTARASVDKIGAPCRETGAVTTPATPHCRGPLLPGLAGALALVFSGVAHAQFENAPSPSEPENEFDQAVANPIREHEAPRTLQGAKRAAERDPTAAAGVPAGVLQAGNLSAWPQLFAAPGLTIRGSLTGTLGLFSMGENAFSLPPSQVTRGYVKNPNWAEFFVEPGLTAQYQLTPAVQFYGGAAYMETATRGTDYAGNANTWHGDMEQLYAGVRWTDAASGLAVDASYGQQDFAVGRNLLISAGADNGPQRGADYMGPRSAWANAALLKATWRDFTATGFWLKPNETTSGHTGTRLEGINVEWLSTGPLRLAGMYVYVPQSDIVTRDGLNVYNVRVRWHPFPAAPNAWLQGEAVWERKANVDADGWYVALNCNALDTPWKPLVTARYASFSGDKPGSAAWEGFDPLYFGGSDPDWYQGKIGSVQFNNTNLDTIAVSLTLTPTEKSILQFVYLNFASGQVNSPLAIPAAGQPVPVGGGVPAKALANEFDAIYTYTFSKQANANAFVGYAAPGAGYRQLYASQGGSAQAWWVVGAQLNFSY